MNKKVEYTAREEGAALLVFFGQRRGGCSPFDASTILPDRVDLGPPHMRVRVRISQRILEFTEMGRGAAVTNGRSAER
jgi:hypothetical protein